MHIKSQDVAIPGDARMGADFKGVAIALPKTKTGPNKFVKLLDPAVEKLLIRAVHGLPPNSFVFPSNSTARADSFRRCLKDSCRALSVEGLGFVPHSLRHGGATFMYINGHSIDEILLRGRWKNTDSARHYIQAGRALLLATKLPDLLASTAPALARDVLASFALAQSLDA
jgi:integrase